MDFRIASTFLDSLRRLSASDQKQVNNTLIDYKNNPAYPGLRAHKVDKSKDKNFWSVRVGSDIRIIVHRIKLSDLFCYVGHHDDAYKWATRRKIEIHPNTGSVQIVEVHEIARDTYSPQYSTALPAATAAERDQTGHLKSSENHTPYTISDNSKTGFSTQAFQSNSALANIPESTLLSYGVPHEWISEVRWADDDTLLNIANHLPEEAAEALLELASGRTPSPPKDIPEVPVKKFLEFSEVERPSLFLETKEFNDFNKAFSHPDSQRRFRKIDDADELKRALEFPWEKWAIFLHPIQEELVRMKETGPVRIYGAAGTGKTIVALHRAVYLARSNENSRVLLTTLSETLAHSLKERINCLVFNEPQIADRIDVIAIDDVCAKQYQIAAGKPNIIDDNSIIELLQESKNNCSEVQSSIHYIHNEWKEVVDAWQIESWDEYKNFKRLGRKKIISTQQRKNLWTLFEMMRNKLREKSACTPASVYRVATEYISNRKHPLYDYIVVDESQDLSVPQFKFIAALGKHNQSSLFFVGDLGQRIFQQAFSWRSLGIDVTGRTETLEVNYRTSNQIQSRVEKLLDKEIMDVDGNVEDRKGTISILKGSHPEIVVLDSKQKESATVAQWIKDRLSDGIKPNQIGVFVRENKIYDRAVNSVNEAGQDYIISDQTAGTSKNSILIGTMHSAKGLEFRAVAVIGCDEDILPLQSSFITIDEESDLDEAYNAERRLLYVACTRARDFLLVTGVNEASIFLDDLS